MVQFQHDTLIYCLPGAFFLSLEQNHTVFFFGFVFVFDHASFWDAERNQDSVKDSRVMQPRKDWDNQKRAANSHFQHVISEQWEPWDVS